uniref:CPXV162 protein n=1 Tax=Strongyloides venezuelensis TaxID=75913 RepID=A0A0K0EYQ2_STRVS
MQNDNCIPIGYQPAYMLSNIIINRDPDSHKETLVKQKRKPSSTDSSDNECLVLTDHQTTDKSKEDKLLSVITSLDNEERTLVEQYDTLNKHYIETIAAFTNVKNDSSATKEQLAQTRIDITNLEATIKNTNRQLAEAIKKLMIQKWI